MPYYRTCPYCGAHLDHGERCDCQKEPEANSQALGNLQKNGLFGVGSTEQAEGGKQSLTDAVSASTITENGGNVK